MKRETLVLAYKTLGVVFGGLVTSPLYVYPSMPLKSPTEDDYLGIYSIMFWTLTLIGVVKYANIAIQADDHGEGTLPTYNLSILLSYPSRRYFFNTIILSLTHSFISCWIHDTLFSNSHII